MRQQDCDLGYALTNAGIGRIFLEYFLAKVKDLSERIDRQQAVSYSVLNTGQYQVFVSALVLEVHVIRMGAHQGFGDGESPVDLGAADRFVDIEESTPAIDHGEIELVG